MLSIDMFNLQYSSTISPPAKSSTTTKWRLQRSLKKQQNTKHAKIISLWAAGILVVGYDPRFLWRMTLFLVWKFNRKIDRKNSQFWILEISYFVSNIALDPSNKVPLFPGGPVLDTIQERRQHFRPNISEWPFKRLERRV